MSRNEEITNIKILKDNPESMKSSITMMFQNPAADVICRMDKDTFDKLIDGRSSFHKAFMTGEMTAKGNFKILRMLDTVFNFA